MFRPRGGEEPAISEVGKDCLTSFLAWFFFISSFYSLVSVRSLQHGLWSEMFSPAPPSMLLFFLSIPNISMEITFKCSSSAFFGWDKWMETSDQVSLLFILICFELRGFVDSSFQMSFLRLAFLMPPDLGLGLANLTE